MKKNCLTLLLIAIIVNSMSLSAQEYKSGDPEIDQVREEVKKQKTTEANYGDRTKILYMWLGALQQQGANTLPFYDLDLRYRTLETKIARTPPFVQWKTKHEEPESQVDFQKSGEYKEAVVQICQTIDECFEQMEKIQMELTDKGPIYTAFEGETEVFVYFFNIS